MSVQRSRSLREPAFLVGALLGVLALGLGLAFLILGLTVGMREGGYLTPAQDLALGIGGLLALVAGVAVRMLRDRLPERYRAAARIGGTLLAAVGLMGALFAGSAETTVSAPFLVSPWDKAILFVAAYVLLIGGLLLLRGAGRMVGW